MVGCSLGGGRLFLGDRYLGRCNDLFTSQAISIAEFSFVINSPPPVTVITYYRKIYAICMIQATLCCESPFSKLFPA